MHPCKFGEIPSTGSRDIIGKRNCHTHVHPEAYDGIQNLHWTNMSPIPNLLTFGKEGGGGTQSYQASTYL